MAKTESGELEAGDRVVAKDDLPGVPTGTPGIVTMIAGLTWRRCHVRFENGADLASLDERHLERQGRYHWYDRPKTGAAG